MKYYVEEDASSFEFWSGARENIATAIELETDDQVFSILEELFADGDCSDTQINDYVWFDMPTDYPELFEEDEEDDDEDEEADEDEESNTIHESKKNIR
jgi:hypothetical protein